ncbi:MAG: aspartate--tRNA(Asn) ligase [Thermoplasmata archaeon]|nr:aspartate--tRNA(Asn) ligase [Thermoplasmata archaeon]
MPSFGPPSHARRSRALSAPRRLSREIATRDGEVVRVAGHLEDYRALGGVAFALVRDRSGTTQVTLKKGAADPTFFTLFGELPRESVVEVEGTVRTSERAHRGVELVPLAVTVLSRAEVPLPLGIVDKVGAELDTRLDHRVLDLRKPAVRAVFELRHAVLAGFRHAFTKRGFLEVETPKLLRQGAEGGATLFPVEYFDQRAFLAQSPQLYKQMLIGAGLERVFEIAPAFRAEPSDTVRHITEFTSLDAEMAYIHGAEDLRATLEAIVQETVASVRKDLSEIQNPLSELLPDLSRPFPRIPFETCEEWVGRPGTEVDFGTEEEKTIGVRAEAEFGSPFYFLIDYPTSVKLRTFYAGRSDADPRKTGYFDLGFRGLEIASGGPREHRLAKLTENMVAGGFDPKNFAGYLEAFRFGMPPHGGWGLGIDRIVQMLAGLANIREARLFPRDRYRLDP